MNVKAVPGFEAQYYPDWTAPKYKASVDQYFGPQFALKSMPNQQLRHAGELLDKNINDRNGKDVGEIEDLVVNMGNGRLHYAVLEFDKSWSLKDKLLAFPLSAFTFTGKDKALVLNVARSKLGTKRARGRCPRPCRHRARRTHQRPSRAAALVRRQAHTAARATCSN